MSSVAKRTKADRFRARELRRGACPCCPTYNWRERVERRLVQRDLKPENWARICGPGLDCGSEDCAACAGTKARIAADLAAMDAEIWMDAPDCDCHLCLLNGAA